ncbi:LysE family transporter [Longispora sp. K20-0274]|uniref:LysE family transporter n=1 Tax=Longispora sp. K20-0274 TaxID=3088255 RepID=UPI00399B2D17
MDAWWSMAVAGGAAGLGVAVPLGGVGVLLMREAMLGWRRGLAAAGAVACVDGAFAAGAVLAGSAVSAALAGHERQVRWAAAVVLAAVAVRGLLVLRRPAAGPVADPPAARIFLRFVGLTAVNPTTMVYFVALAAALRGQLGGGPLLGVFVAGVLLASLAWQVALAVFGATVGARLGSTARRWTAIGGTALVLGYAVVLATS